MSKQAIKDTKALGGACCACRYKKSMCPPNVDSPNSGPCLRCLKINPALCYRYSVNDASLYRKQERPYHLFSKRWKSMELVDIQDWVSDKVVTIVVSQVFLHAPYELKVGRFEPREGDMLEEVWYDGNVKKSFPIPPYAIVNMKEASQAIGKMTEACQHEYLSAIIQSGNGPRNGDFIWNTFLFAFKHISEIKDEDSQVLLRQAFRMWQACRLTSYPEAIVGSETLGLQQRVSDRASPWTNQFPIPPVMCAQLECILYSQFLEPWSKQIRTLLDKVLRKGSRTDWLSVYLTLFILLHSCGLLIERDYKYARQLGLKERYANPSAVMDHQRGAITLLAHFHIVLDGARPFRLAAQGLATSKKQQEFTPREQVFVASTYEKVRMMDFSTIRQVGDPKNVWYWLSQLYDEKWEPDKMG
ncbi:hypothetical protein jhhlp_006317 [Lomentospora prolificans]|uniref:Zn(2)-C6 fungal-type domain-containing protein n=1 Tax=Lomentospora prolificans TaxID=41688 RepID=A0A2N3N5K2_9PEZI|nr:hypothetical protein jhhlp_006317 [Lomentospora prolificans]